MRKYLALAAVVLLVLTGCTSGDDDSDAETSDTTGTTAVEGSTTTEAEPTGPSPGVTADTIKVGVTYVDLEAIRDFTTIDHGDYETAYRSLVDAINADGGINGRTIELVFAPISPIGTQPADEACVKLTQDEQVFAVLGFFQADAPLCYLETHETAVVGGTMSQDRLQRAKAPWFTTVAGSDFEADSIRAMAEAGELDGALAVFANTQDEALLNDTVKPLLDELGITPVDTAILDAPEDDVAAQNTATAVIAERFKSSGATKVLIIGGGGLNWANGVENTDYRPQLYFTTTNSISAYTEDEAGRDLSLMEGAVAGALYGPADDRYALPNMQECLAIQEAAGLSILTPSEVPDGEPQQYVSSFAACENVTLFAAMVEAAGENLNYGTFQKAGEELGAIDIPGFPDAFTFGPIPATDGDPVVYLFTWDAAGAEFVRKDA